MLKAFLALSVILGTSAITQAEAPQFSTLTAFDVDSIKLQDSVNYESMISQRSLKELAVDSPKYKERELPQKLHYQVPDFHRMDPSFSAGELNATRLPTLMIPANQITVVDVGN